MNLAMEAHIDAFALNIAAGWVGNDAQIANAFTAANSLGFKLFFSFDYAGNGPWAESDVYNLIRTYGWNAAYYQYNGAPFVSTFEGTDNANDWITIKAETGCFFMPDWSSRGAEVALKLGGGVADGLFSWAAWAWGSWNMTTYVDASYNQTLNGKPYMMPVSPWFFTNLPGYKKNWLWRSDDLWYDRWQQVLYFQPEFVEIISWNDFGESHYIGPLDDTQYSAFTIGNAPYNYVENMPHDGWRQLLPYVVDTYKNGHAAFDTEVLVTWYRPTLASACGDGGTTANTASQLQIEYRPVDIVDDRIFISALLSEPAYLTINYGVGEYGVDWDYTPEGGVGIYHASMALNGQTGSLTIQLLRDSGVFISYNPSQGISTTCTNDITNWNVWVGSATYTLTSTIPPPLSLSKQVCVQGWGVGNFEGLYYDFQFLACSGSLTNDKKMEHQLESWNNVTSNFATITIGGNDAGFSKVLIQCILQPPFYGKGGHWWSGETFDCDGEISNAQAVIADKDFTGRLSALYQQILDIPPADQQFALYVAGYSQFFDTTNKADCGTLGLLWYKPPLTLDLRQKINSLTLQVNEKIQQAIANVTVRPHRSITYVDWDSRMDGHRFCTPGYSDEPITNKYEAAHEYFFPSYDTEDNYEGEEDQWPPSSSTTYPVDSQTYSFSVDPKTCANNLDNSGDIFDPDELSNIWCTWAIESATNASFAAAIEAYMTPQSASSADGNITVVWTGDEMVVTFSGSASLGSTAQIFHPKSLGHAFMAEGFLAAIQSSR
ncbi:hypothetical protein CNMCM6805_000525 [Aspergillus fumigatiaffinis]|uniref:Alpha-1,3-glucanase/mutanase n=1 Tax=Aspergillus fumigatiaffinis TaxID=340414 RepID=A0A8H4M6Y5_9EURO|nr:hypothetical protein CNMCM6805_000525 [Aspergillus fumigatiaffinis]